VALYAAIADEVPVDSAALRCRERGVRTVYPRRGSNGIELRLVADSRQLERRGRPFPEPDDEAPLVAVEAVDAFVVPGLLFDRSCRRLGRGGGDYDRLLARARPDAARVGICYADRVLAELPEDPWDVAMDVVVTDRFELRRAAERRR
jgi:5-formyltetrahydrofolate cyclo-ligase